LKVIGFDLVYEMRCHTYHTIPGGLVDASAEECQAPGLLGHLT